MTACINYQTDEDDDLSLADIISLKISSPSTKEKMIDNIMWNDWTQNELYHQQQLQSSYYQLQSLQQQQMMMMMRQYNASSHTRRSSTISSISSTNSSRPSFLNHHHYLQLTPSSSSNSSVKHRSSESSNHSRSTRNSNHNTMSVVPAEPPKRRQSLGKRIKKAFGMVETPMMTVDEKVKKKETVELPNSILTVDTTSSASSKKKIRSSIHHHTIAPDSPGSSISSRSHHSRRPYLDKLPSPASSTVSTTSTQSTNISTASKKSLSFNPVIKLHETFSAHEYDRRCDTSATCQKLTPVLALKIKEELNNFKLNDMFVHIESRKNTHFFM